MRPSNPIVRTPHERVSQGRVVSESLHRNSKMVSSRPRDVCKIVSSAVNLRPAINSSCLAVTNRTPSTSKVSNIWTGATAGLWRLRCAAAAAFPCLQPTHPSTPRGPFTQVARCTCTSMFATPFKRGHSTTDPRVTEAKHGVCGKLDAVRSRRSRSGCTCPL
jgi:hypothetical protein